MKRIVLLSAILIGFAMLIFGGLFWYGSQTETDDVGTEKTVSPEGTAGEENPTEKLLQGMWISDDDYLETLIFRENGRFELHYAVYEDTERAETPIFKAYETLEGSYNIAGAAAGANSRCYPFILHLTPDTVPEESSRTAIILQEEEWELLDLTDKYQLQVTLKTENEERMCFVKQISGQ